MKIVSPLPRPYYTLKSFAPVNIRIDIPNIHGIECKFSEAPKITKAMNQAFESLNLAHLWIVYPGEHPYPLSKQISVWPMKDIATLRKEFG